MKKVCFVIFISLGILVGGLVSCENVKSTKVEEETPTSTVVVEKETPTPTVKPDDGVAYDNPIDEYFVPKIEYARKYESEASKKRLQDSYAIVWEREYINLIDYLKEKCVYKEDKNAIIKMKKSTYTNIDNTIAVVKTDFLDDYSINPDPEKCIDHVSRISSPGNSTRSRLNQIKGEMFRDEVMRILSINREYVFVKQDYTAVVDSEEMYP